MKTLEKNIKRKKIGNWQSVKKAGAFLIGNLAPKHRKLKNSIDFSGRSIKLRTPMQNLVPKQRRTLQQPDELEKRKYKCQKIIDVCDAKISHLYRELNVLCGDKKFSSGADRERKWNAILAEIERLEATAAEAILELAQLDDEPKDKHAEQVFAAVDRLIARADEK